MSILKEWFGPSREEIWKELSAQISGQYIPGDFWKGPKVRAKHGDWNITLETYYVSDGKIVMEYTRIRAPFVTPDGFQFSIYSKGIFTDLGKMFGMQDIEVGDPAFDDAFVIKGKNEGQVRALFQNVRIRDLISAQWNITLGIKRASESLADPSIPPNVALLEFSVHGILNDLDVLRSLFDLFAETLDELCKMGSACKDAPGISI